ncbi:MAG: hypothetical protein MUE81_05865 [Thermoflexibacter sp.]|jgi:hypothetical protein|nr:hypothetical protein [Thermoflexibacter sp.]
MSYKEGIYIQQNIGNTHIEALQNWALDLDIKGIKGLGLKSKQNLIKSLNDELHKPVLLKNLTNAWCTSIILNGHLAIINFVKTAKN